MIRKITYSTILISLIFLFGFQSNAQDYKPFKLGLKISPNLGWLNPNTKDYKSGNVAFGGVIGLVTDFYFSEQYAISTGLNFSFLGGSLKYRDQLITEQDTMIGDMVRKIRIIYIEVPLMLKMKTRQFGDFSFYGQAGFSAGFNLSSSAEDDFTSDQGKNFSEKKDFSGNTTLMRGAVCIGLGTEYHLDTSTRLILGINYSNSLNNVLKGTNSLTHSNVKAWLNYLELNIGVMF